MYVETMPFFFFDKCQFLFLWTIIMMYYMYIFALKLSESNVINILYICKFLKDYLGDVASRNLYGIGCIFRDKFII